MAVREGKPAPTFELEDGEGRQVALDDLAGKDVVLFFYPEDDTPTCTKEACSFRDVWKEFGKLGAVLYGVSPDSGESHRAFAKKFKLPFPLLSDPTHAMMKRYDAWGKKMMFGNEVTGVLRSTVWIGRDGKVKRHWARIADAAEHPAHVIEALKQA